jgi:uncharacterized protein (TIGR01777 family)
LKITISGASGLIGRRLLKTLVAEGHAIQVLSRHAGTNMPGNVKVFPWDPAKSEPPADALRDVDAVVHLAGEPVAQRWTGEVKRKIRESRVAGTTNLVSAIAKLRQRPKALVCSSATGYYGERGDEILTESSAPGNDYLAEVCTAWEGAAQTAEAFGVRVARLRTGIVLDGKGGALAKMLPPFKMGVGGKIGSGRQWMSWIHAEDLVGIIGWALNGAVSGAVNGVGPNPATNEDFTKALAATLKRPAIFPVPAFGLKLLFGEMSEVLLGSQRVLPKVAEAGGYRFKYPELGAALADALRTV